jgi:transposase
MGSSVTEMSRGVRRRLQRVVQRSRDKDYARRALALLHLWESAGDVSQAAHRVRAARSSVYRWQSLFESYGEEGLKPQSRGREDWKATHELLGVLEQLVQTDPRELGYLRSRWSSELLAKELQRRSGVKVHCSTIRRWLSRLEFGYRRARPTLYKRDPRKTERLAAIDAALADKSPYTEVFYVDEADIDLNPRIGPAWMRKGEQAAIPTPGQNRKHYLAGALHAHSGQLVWVEHHRKNSVLFIRLLEQLRRQYRRARRIRLILDNYRIHKSRLVERWLLANPKFELLFQPAYHPWVNVIERLWKAMHDTVTRNHRCRSMFELCQHVKRFLDVVQPFPGNNHAVADFCAVI